MQGIFMERRDFLGSLATLLGVATLPVGALAAPARFAMPAAQMAIATAYADTLIPRTDSPGAVDAGVPKSFGAMLANWAAPETLKSMLAELDAIEAAGKAQSGTSFSAMKPAARLAMLKAYDAANFPRREYKRLRDMMLVLYYNSEPGATQELRYEHAPGPLEPSLPITPQTRAWASLSFF